MNLDVAEPADVFDLSHSCSFFFFFNDTATTEIYTLSLHDALPICRLRGRREEPRRRTRGSQRVVGRSDAGSAAVLDGGGAARSEEHTSELQSLRHLVCRLLLEKKKKLTIHHPDDESIRHVIDGSTH